MHIHAHSLLKAGLCKRQMFCKVARIFTRQILLYLQLLLCEFDFGVILRVKVDLVKCLVFDNFKMVSIVFFRHHRAFVFHKDLQEEVVCSVNVRSHHGL